MINRCLQGCGNFLINKFIHTFHDNASDFSEINTTIKELFKEVSEKIGSRPGGYTRIIKLGQRQDDGAEMCFIELVDFDENMAKTGKAAKKTRRSRKSSAKAEAAPAAEAPATEEAKAE